MILAMNNTFYFLRHEVTKIDGTIPVSKWQLSKIGEENAKKLAQQDFFDEVAIIFSSTEKKAYQTAKPIADKLKKEIIQVQEISELNRDKGGFMQIEDFEKTLKQSLEHLDVSINNWETATHALERFSKKVDEIDKQYENKKILIVGHGITINLYFAKLLGLLDTVYLRLDTNSYGDWGIVKDKEVIKDIAE